MLPILSVEKALTIARRKIGTQESRWLLQAITNLSSPQLILQANRPLTTLEQQQFHHALKRRTHGEPLDYILGYSLFSGEVFQVNNTVLIPRPETECLVDWVVHTATTYSNIHQPFCILELGVGSGAPLAIVGMRLLKKLQPHLLKLYGTDCSSQALQTAQQNLYHKNITATLLNGDWFSAIQSHNPHQLFHIIYSNPPYIAIDHDCLNHDGVRAEPPLALLAKEKGMSALFHIIDRAPVFLQNNGWIGLEHGYLQAKACQDRFKKKGYRYISTLDDAYGKQRVTFAQCPKKRQYD